MGQMSGMIRQMADGAIQTFISSAPVVSGVVAGTLAISVCSDKNPTNVFVMTSIFGTAAMGVLGGIGATAASNIAAYYADFTRKEDHPKYQKIGGGLLISFALATGSGLGYFASKHAEKTQQSEPPTNLFIPAPKVSPERK